jgi:YggT family protein
MLIKISAFLLETFFFALIGATLLRAYMNTLRMSMVGQPGQFVMAITDWLVKPLRRALPATWAQSRVDTAILLAASVLALLYALIWLGWQFWAQDGSGPVVAWILTVLLFALQVLVRVTLHLAVLTVLAYIIVSWTQPGGGAYYVLTRLTAPLLAPLRRVLPIIGGVDLSALVLLLLLQIAMQVLT